MRNEFKVRKESSCSVFSSSNFVSVFYQIQGFNFTVWWKRGITWWWRWTWKGQSSIWFQDWLRRELFVWSMGCFLNSITSDGRDVAGKRGVPSIETHTFNAWNCFRVSEITQFLCTSGVEGNTCSWKYSSFSVDRICLFASDCIRTLCQMLNCILAKEKSFNWKRNPFLENKQAVTIEIRPVPLRFYRWTMLWVSSVHPTWT